jgi:hypothetical protein
MLLQTERLLSSCQQHNRNLENNLIDYIDSHVINTYVNLSIISLRFNRIKRIQNFSFKDLKKLTRM